MPKKVSQLRTLAEADQTLRILGEHQRKIADLESDAQADIDAIKKYVAEQRVGPDAVVKSCTRLLAKFIKAHADEIEERGRGKTVRLTFGRIGTRTSPAALRLNKGFSESDAIAMLRRVFPNAADAFIAVTERLRRDDLKLWDEERLERCGMRIEQEEVVVIEPADDVARTEVA